MYVLDVTGVDVSVVDVTGVDVTGGSIHRLVRNDRKKFNEMRWLLCLTQSVSL